jgi:hypothetical protein
MPSVCLLIIQECQGGIAIEQLPIQKGTELERTCAGVMDLGLKLAQEALTIEITRHGGTGKAIEGKDIEAYVTRGLKQIEGIDFRTLLKKAGYIIDGKE